jgi:hypothetical protein
VKKSLKYAIALCIALCLIWPAAIVAGLFLGIGERIESAVIRVAGWFDEWIDGRGES